MFKSKKLNTEKTLLSQKKVKPLKMYRLSGNIETLYSLYEEMRGNSYSNKARYAFWKYVSNYIPDVVTGLWAVQYCTNILMGVIVYQYENEYEKNFIPVEIMEKEAKEILLT